MRSDRVPGETLSRQTSADGVSFVPLVRDQTQSVHGVLQQRVKDAVRQLHLHKQLVLVVVDPLGLFLVEFLDLMGIREEGE